VLSFRPTSRARTSGRLLSATSIFILPAVLLTDTRLETSALTQLRNEHGRCNVPRGVLRVSTQDLSTPRRALTSTSTASMALQDCPMSPSYSPARAKIQGKRFSLTRSYSLPDRRISNSISQTTRTRWAPSLFLDLLTEATCGKGMIITDDRRATALTKRPKAVVTKSK
jgi:hypothetical protein